MAKTKNIKGGSLNTLAQETIDNNTMYAVTNYPQGGITNAQMTSALTQIGWYKDGDVFLCTDSGTYEQNKFYEYKVNNGTASWVEHKVGEGLAVLTGTTDPTSATVGQVGQFYLNTATPQLFQCTAVSGSTYTWGQVGGGGHAQKYQHNIQVRDASTNNAYFFFSFVNEVSSEYIRISDVRDALLSVVGDANNNVTKFIMANGYYWKDSSHAELVPIFAIAADSNSSNYLRLKYYESVPTQSLPSQYTVRKGDDIRLETISDIVFSL